MIQPAGGVAGVTLGVIRRDALTLRLEGDCIRLPGRHPPMTPGHTL